MMSDAIGEIDRRGGIEMSLPLRHAAAPLPPLSPIRQPLFAAIC